MTQLRPKNSKGVESRGTRLDLMRFAKVDYYSSLEAKVRTNFSLEQTNFSFRKLFIFLYAAEDTY